MASNDQKPHPKSEFETISFTFDDAMHDDHQDVMSRFDEIDAKVSSSPRPSFSRPVPSPKLFKPGKLHPSKTTTERYYDTSNPNRGVALIFNHSKFKNDLSQRSGTIKDGEDLFKVLSGLGFDVRDYLDLPTKEVQNILYNVSRENHDDNDCLLVVVMSHGNENGKIFAADGEYDVQELWKNFIGNECPTLIGKPKLFFVQACRGSLVDPGVMFKPKPQSAAFRMADEMDSIGQNDKDEDVFVIPALADLLVMYSTAEGYYSFRNTNQGSWFIQALCAELLENPKEDLLNLLTSVNRRVAFGYQSNIPDRHEYDASKQMPNIVSMLTKIFYFTKKLGNQDEQTMMINT